MSNVVIEKNVPMPVNRSVEERYRMPRKWPWHEMNPGDSFVVQTVEEARTANNSFMAHKRTKYCRFAPSWGIFRRKQPDGTYRLWMYDKNETL